MSETCVTCGQEILFRKGDLVRSKLGTVGVVISTGHPWSGEPGVGVKVIVLYARPTYEIARGRVMLFCGDALRVIHGRLQIDTPLPQVKDVTPV